MIDSVPLIQNPNDVQQINASIIAMKKASRELDEKIVKLNSLNSELDKKIALLDSGLNKEIEDRKEAINSLDVASVGGSGKYISAISETDGKISATASDITSSVSSGNSQPVTSGGVAEAIAPLQPIDSVTSENLQPVSSNAVYNAIGGKGLKYKDITFIMADMSFTHVTSYGRDFWYCNIAKDQYFKGTQRIIGAMIIYFSGTPPIIAHLDGDASLLAFIYWNNVFSSSAYFKVRYLYLEL